MSGLFGGGAPAAPSPPPPIPTMASPGVLAAQQAEASQQAQAAGRASTLLTSGTGVSTPAVTQKKTLLGG
jgi:hypothetical protein